jgi:hypothetical protein
LVFKDENTATVKKLKGILMGADSYHMRMATDPHFQSTGLVEKIETEAQEQNLLLLIDNDLNTWGDEFKGLDAPHNYRALFTIELMDSFFQSSQAEAIKDIFPKLVVHCLNVLDGIVKRSEVHLKDLLQKALQLYPLCVYNFSESVKLHFSFPLPEKNETMIDAWQKMREILLKLRSSDSETCTWINSISMQKNGMSFLKYNYEKEEWQLIDRLKDGSLRLSEAYKNSINDERVRKPYIVFNEDNYNQYNYFDNQWSLKIDQETIILPQPNDISLYVKLAERNLKDAEQFYQEELKNRVGRLHMPLLSKDAYLKYYDYFESVIAAITFSYTSIETLANICIPHQYSFEEKGTGKREGITTVYSKEAIERNFPLRDKFKIILQDVLHTGNPVVEDWWNDFIDLEEIRNEIIHTKQSKSEERYSFFLNRRIFKVIGCNKVIIKYYGEYIQRHLPNLLFDFPYGLGYDSVPASFMTNEEYIQRYEALHNPWKPKK